MNNHEDKLRFLKDRRMKCPLCGKEMEKGFVQTGERISWVRQKHKVFLRPKEGEVLLGNNIFLGLAFEAHIRKSCKKIVLDYDGADYQEG